MALPNSIIAGSYPVVAPSEYPGGSWNSACGTGASSDVAPSESLGGS